MEYSIHILRSPWLTLRGLTRIIYANHCSLSPFVVKLDETRDTPFKILATLSGPSESGGQGGDCPFPDFVNYCSPILIKGRADYAHHNTTSPLEFQNLLRPCPRIFGPACHRALWTQRSKPTRKYLIKGI
jgi:hypothetical protein